MGNQIKTSDGLTAFLIEKGGESYYHVPIDDLRIEFRKRCPGAKLLFYQETNEKGIVVEAVCQADDDIANGIGFAPWTTGSPATFAAVEAERMIYTMIGIGLIPGHEDPRFTPRTKAEVKGASALNATEQLLEGR